MHLEIKNQLKISLIQFDIIWEDAKANYAYLDKILNNHQTDIILLPEMFASGFSMNVNKIAEEPFGESFKWLETKAKELGSAIAGSIATKEGEKYYNRFYFISPGGSVFIYDKKHLFGYGKEADVYSAGDRISTIYYKGWKIRPIVCYDLRFPVWIRNTETHPYDLLLCNANWPIKRIDAWKTLLKARAIENMSYVVGVNRVGEDGYGLQYSGDSLAFDAIGENLPIINQNSDNIFQFIVDKHQQDTARSHFNFLNDRDNFYFG